MDLLVAVVEEVEDILEEQLVSEVTVGHLAQMAPVEEQLQMEHLQELEVLEVEQIQPLQEEELVVAVGMLAIMEEVKDQVLMDLARMVVLVKEDKEAKAPV